MNREKNEIKISKTFPFSREHLHVKMEHISIEKIFLWLYQI
jgi:hypothetical protein